MPPATTRSASPRATVFAARITACRPEPQTLLTVVAGTVTGMPAWMAAWRAGACPMPAESTLPMKTSCTASAGSLARASAPLIAVAPRPGAADGGEAPRNAPMGVRAAADTT